MKKKLRDLYSKLSSREKTILIGTLTVVALVLVDRLVLSPVLRQMKSLDSRIRQQQSLVKKSAHVLARKEQILSESQQLASYALSSGKPDQEMTSFLQELQESASKASVTLVFVKPAGGGEEGGPPQKYLANLECEGNLTDLGKFFYAIESSADLQKVEKYQIQSKGKGSGQARCTLTVSRAAIA